jgi:uncharacterized protein YfaS (alpha-2-macroglobulin family)
MRKKSIFINILFILIIGLSFVQGENLNILKVSPQGRLKSIKGVEITVVFSDDMKILGEKRDIGKFIEIKPIIKGRLRWRGNSIIVFRPDKRFKYSTEYKIKIKKGLKSINGKILGKEYFFKFRTPTPIATGIKQKKYWDNFYGNYKFYKNRIEYEYYQKIKTDKPILLKFNQNIDNITNLNKIEIYENKTLNIVKTKKSFSGSNIISLSFTKPLKKGTKYFIKIEKGFSGTEGTIKTERDIIINFKTEDRFKYSGKEELYVFMENSGIRLSFNKIIEKNSDCLIKNRIRIFEVSDNKKEEIKEFKQKCRYRTIYIDLKSVKKKGVYLIKIPENFSDSEGETLGKTIWIKLKVCGWMPNVKFNTIEKGKLKIDIKGISKIEFKIMRINDPIKFSTLGFFKEKENVKAVRTAVFSFENKGGYNSVFIDFIKLFKTTKGIYMVKIENIKLDNRCKSSEKISELIKKRWMYIINPTNIYSSALTLKGGTYIFGKNRKTDNPLSGMDFYMFSKNKLFLKTKTGKQGAAFINKKIIVNRWYYRNTDLFLLKKGNDISVSLAAKGWVSGRGDLNETDIFCKFFTDRANYLPGETVHIGGVLKKSRRNDFIKLKNNKAELIIRNPDYKTIKIIQLTLDKFGGFKYDFKSDKYDKKGIYSFIIKKKGWKSYPYSVRIDYFKPNIIEVSAKPEKTEIIADGKNKIFVKGSYLSGAPMAQDKAVFNTKIFSSCYFFLKKLKPDYREYTFNSPYINKRLKTKTQYFDKQGKTIFSISLEKEKIHSLSIVKVETIGITKDGKEYSVGSHINYIPGDAITGIKVPYFVKTGKIFNLKLAALNSKGEETSSNVRLLIERKYWNREKYRMETETISNNSFTIKGKMIKKIKFNKPGSYKISAFSKDNSGWITITEARFFVWNTSYSFSEGKQNKLTIKTDKKKYKIGDTAKLFISSPRKSKGIIYIFTEKLEEKHIINLDKTTEFSLKIRKRFFPSVGFLIITHYKDKNRKRITKSAFTRIDAENPDKRIDIKLSLLKELSPAKDYSIKIKTINSIGKGIKTALFVFAVDEGVLSLSGYKTPDFFSAFFSHKVVPYAFFDTYSKKDIFFPFYNIRDKMPGVKYKKQLSLSEKVMVREKISIVMPSAKAPTPSANLNKIKLRNLFKTTLFFKKIGTDKNGEAIVKFKTSDLLSTYRLIAVAYNKNLFGSEDMKFRVTKKLLMKESYPDFLREGDSSKAGVMLTNRTDKTLNVKVIVKTDDKIKIEGKSEKTISIEPMNTKTVYFKTTAIKEGKSLIKFYAISDKLKDGFEKKVEIKKNIIRESFLDFASGKKINKRYKLGNKKQPKLKLIFSSSIIDSSFNIAKKLIIYPYECLEQRTSKIMPFLMIDEGLYKYGEFKYNKKQISKRIKEYIKKLNAFKNKDGGMGYYENSKSSPYLTAYVLYALKLIKDRGYNIDKKTVKDILHYLEWNGKDNSFTLYVKTLWGKEESANIKRKFKDLENLSLLSKAFLLKAIAISKILEKNDMIERIIKNYEKHIFVEADFAYFKKPQKYDKFEYPFYSNRYLTAVILSSILEAKGEYVFADKMIRYLVEKKNNPWWWFSTHTNVWTIDAINQYVKNMEKGYGKGVDIKIYEEGREIFKKLMKFVHPKQKFVKILETKYKSREIKLSSSSKGVFYLSSELNQTADISKASDNGIRIERRIYNKKGEMVKNLKRGEIYQVVIRVVTIEPMDYVVIDEPVIGGIMVLREDFKTTRELFDFRKDKKRRYWSWWWGVKRREYKKDGIVFYTYRIGKEIEISYHIKAMYSGKYTQLPTSAFSMYHPQFNGRERVRISEVR